MEKVCRGSRWSVKSAVSSWIPSIHRFLLVLFHECDTGIIFHTWNIKKLRNVFKNIPKIFLLFLEIIL